MVKSIHPIVVSMSYFIVCVLSHALMAWRLLVNMKFDMILLFVVLYNIFYSLPASQRARAPKART